MHIAVVGSGYVGLVAGGCFADLGHEVILVDNDQQKLAALNAGQVPIHENFLPELLQRHRGRRLSFSDNLQQAVRVSAVIFIAVGTPPTEQGDADLSYIESVARSISSAINGYKVIVEKSTVPVYTSDWVRKIILRNTAENAEFDVASNPEFLREGTAVTDFLYPDRIVVGADTDRCALVLREIYAPLSDGSYYQRPDAIPKPDRARIPPPLIVTSAKSAELIKHASNAFLAMKISFINAVASICESVGANVQQVVEGIGSDSRIGPRFLNPGIGYGGSCFPKDLSAFRAVARECGYEFRLLDEVMRINQEQRHRFLRKVRSALWTLRGNLAALLQQGLDQQNGGRFADRVCPPLEGQAEQSPPPAPPGPPCAAHLAQESVALLLVDTHHFVEQTKLVPALPRHGAESQQILGKAGAAIADSRIQKTRSDAAVGSDPLADLLHVRSYRFANRRHRIDERNLQCKKCIRRVLDQLRALGAGHDQGRWNAGTFGLRDRILAPVITALG